MKRVILATTFIMVLATGGVPALAQAPAPAAPGEPVLVTPAVRQTVPLRLEAIANVQSISSVAIKSRLDAQISATKVHDGQYVKAGDVLFELDARAAEAQTRQAEGQLARDKAQLAYAQLEVKRFAPLAEKSYVSREQFEQAESTAASLAAAVQADQAAVENAKVLLSYYTIRAPIDGRLGTIALKTGNNVKANDVPFATLTQLQPIYVSFSVPQRELAAIRAAMSQGPVPVTAVIAGDNGPPLTGQIAYFENSVDAGTSTLSLKALFPNGDERLWPGQFVNASVLLRQEPDQIVVPQNAIQIGQQSAYLFVVKDDNTAQYRPVTVGRTVDGKTIVTSGLDAGERVVIDGQLRLHDGSRITPREPPYPLGSPPGFPAAKSGSAS